MPVMMLSPSAPMVNANPSASVCSTESLMMNGVTNAITMIAPTHTSFGRVLKSASSWA